MGSSKRLIYDIVSHNLLIVCFVPLSFRPGEPWLLCPSKMRKLSGSDFKIRKNFFSVDAVSLELR